MTQIDTSEKDEKRLITNAYRQLLRSVKVQLNDDDRTMLRRAYEIAVEAHHEQRRMTGEPYILHPIAVARICAEEIGLGATGIAAALLHDVVEDTKITTADIQRSFGDRVAMIVEGLTKFDRLETQHAESPQAMNYSKIIGSMVEDVRVVLIKMADRLHNMRTLGAMKVEKQMKIASETSFFYAPLAHRLGLYQIKTELQDLSMKILEPELYHQIERQLADTEKERKHFIREFIKPIEERVQAYCAKESYTFRIVSRTKSISSVANKLRNKHVEFEDIYDIFAVRIILDNVPSEAEKHACWAVFADISDIYKPIAERLKDWVSSPKMNGYESLHTTVVAPSKQFVEVQIRTRRMDEIAERGFAAHWRYKGVMADRRYDDWLNKIREIVEERKLSQERADDFGGGEGMDDSLELLEDVRSSLFSDEVYVYTPKGDTRILPRGATALDFAFEIHTNVGQRCQSAKVNGKLVPLSHVLENGDVVKIHTVSTQHPTDSWLKWVITGKARNKIRTALREEKRKAGELGKEALERKLKHLKLGLEENVEVLAKFFKQANRIDLYYSVAQGEIDLTRIKELRIEGNKLLLPIAAPTHNGLATLPDEPAYEPNTNAKNAKQFLIVSGQNIAQYQYSFATCCNPVPGDPVFALLSTGSGIKIHRTSCKNAEHIYGKYSNRIMPAEWVDTLREPFTVKLRIIGIDQIGVVQTLTDVITNKLNINISSISIKGDAGYYEGLFEVTVYSADQLQFLSDTLKAIKGVVEVGRVE